MKPKSKNWAPVEELDTPYKRARQEWDDRMGNASAQAANWRLATFAVLGLVAFPSVVGLIYLGAQPKSVPHIVEIGVDGVANYKGPVGRSVKEYAVSDASMKYYLRQFIEKTRTLSSDPAVIKKNWIDVYSFVAPSARNILDTYAMEDIPFERAKDKRISVEIIAMLPTSADTWQIDWKESIWGVKGNHLADEYWRGSFTTSIKKVENEALLEMNPLGIFIDEFYWSKIRR